jgi:hypothetical protein
MIVTFKTKLYQGGRTSTDGLLSWSTIGQSPSIPFQALWAVNSNKTVGPGLAPP